MKQLLDKQLKTELKQDWYVVQNGNQIDIHARSYNQGREFTIASNIRPDYTDLIVNAPRLKTALNAAIVLIETIGTTAAEEPDRIKAAQKWLMEFSHERQEPQTIPEMTLREYVNQLPDFHKAKRQFEHILFLVNDSKISAEGVQFELRNLLKK